MIAVPQSFGQRSRRGGCARRGTRQPNLFFTAPGYEGAPLVMLRLAQVGVDRLRELLTDAWQMRAPEERGE